MVVRVLAKWRSASGLGDRAKTVNGLTTQTRDMPTPSANESSTIKKAISARKMACARLLSTSRVKVARRARSQTHERQTGRSGTDGEPDKDRVHDDSEELG